MKKRMLSFILLLCLSSLTILGLTGCGDNGPQKLEAPVIVLNDDTATWDENLDASKFEISLDGKLSYVENTYTSEKLTDGQSLKVRAVGDGVKFETSDWSNIVTYTASHTHDFTGVWKSDGTHHWHECSCGEVETKVEHTGGTATTTEKAKCEVCGTSYGELKAPDHIHEATGDWKNDETHHWKECSCGAPGEKVAHSGGSATCTEKAKCKECEREYGSLLEHSYTELKYSEIEHWYECKCGAVKTDSLEAHKGGYANTAEKAKCEVCNQPYGELMTPDHVHEVIGEWKSDNTHHWKECSCGAPGEKIAHSGGSATCTSLAKCETCEKEYGLLLEHNYNELEYDENNHWYKCLCGAIKPNSHETHFGGTATTAEKAKCEVCNQPYGQLEEIKTLSVPQVVLDEATGVVSWEAVLGATHYNYIINGGEILSTVELSIILENETNISVQAANEEVVSSFSNAITFYDLSDVIIKEEKEVYVYFHNTNLAPQIVKTGTTISKPTNLVKENYIFDDFYEDPFYQTKFDFSKPIEEKTIIYANWLPSDWIKDTYYWVKGDSKMTSQIMSASTTHGWHFTPLVVNEGQKEFKEYRVTVSVVGATTEKPCYFIVMDGFDDNAGRTYWKKADGSDFTIKSDGIYDIYFSVEHEYGEKNVHIFVAAATNTSLALINNELNLESDIPNIIIDKQLNKASWQAISGAVKYQVVINNGEVLETTETSIDLPVKSHISVRAVFENRVSKWSEPKANINYAYEQTPKEEYIYVYFKGMDSVKVKKDMPVEKPNEPILEGHSFGGWYYDLACSKPVSFPFTVDKNIVLYPKWVLNGNYTVDEYYNLVTESGAKIKGLVWNLDNYSFDEYETGLVSLTKNTKYYIEKIGSSKKWGPYSVNTSGEYKIYFSEDYYWDVGTDKQRNIYFALQTADEPISQVITVYFSNNKWWDGEIKAYIWNDTSDAKVANWPGTKMTWVKKNNYGEDIYKIDVDMSKYDHIIFTNGSAQTGNISLVNVSSGTGYYIKDDGLVESYKYQ